VLVGGVLHGWGAAAVNKERHWLCVFVSQERALCTTAVWGFLRADGSAGLACSLRLHAEVSLVCPLTWTL